jgi:hypothetical protein
MPSQKLDWNQIQIPLYQGTYGEPLCIGFWKEWWTIEDLHENIEKSLYYLYRDGHIHLIKRPTEVYWKIYFDDNEHEDVDMHIKIFKKKNKYIIKFKFIGIERICLHIYEEIFEEFKKVEHTRINHTNKYNLYLDPPSVPQNIPHNYQNDNVGRPLPCEWSIWFSDEFQRYYYFNQETLHSQWEYPESDTVSEPEPEREPEEDIFETIPL